MASPIARGFAGVFPFRVEIAEGLRGPLDVVEASREADGNERGCFRSPVDDFPENGDLREAFVFENGVAFQRLRGDVGVEADSEFAAFAFDNEFGQINFPVFDCEIRICVREGEMPGREKRGVVREDAD